MPAMGDRGATGVLMSESVPPPDSTRQPAAAMFELRHIGVSLSTAIGPVEILRDVTFNVNDGEFLAIVGRSGTGKTTLLRVLAGLLPPSSGTVLHAGRPLDGPPETVVMVFQDYGQALLPWRTVERNVALGLERSVGKTERRERVLEALEMVGLERRAQEYPWRLSGGMQQRVQIARALAMRPSVLLMDEPFGALDAMTKASLQDQLLEVQARTGATIVFITHDIDEAAYLSDRVLVMHSNPGTTAAPIQTSLERPRDQIATREQARYLGLRAQLGNALRHDA
jgi:NitT/TauT family transport system ATP-binding protein